MEFSQGEWVIIGLLVGPPLLGIAWGVFRYFVLGLIGAAASRFEDWLVHRG